MLTSTIRKFFWGKTQNRYLAPIKWDIATRDLQEGGLGVKNLQVFNQALMMKAVWAVACNKPTLWVQLVKAKYCMEKGLWGTSKKRGCSQLWKNIQQLKPLLKDSVFWDIRNGHSVQIKYQPWYPGWDRPNRKMALQNPTVAQCFDGATDSWLYHSLTTTLSANHCNNILQHAKKPNIDSDLQDRLIWKYTQSGSYTAYLGYKFLMAQQNTPQLFMVQPPFNWNKLWTNKNLLPKIKVFIWRAIHEGLLTADKMGRILNSPHRHCQVCGFNRETDTHILFHCPLARAVWFSSTLAIRTENLPQQLGPLLNALFDQLSKDQYTILCNLMWNIWKSRNKLVFQGKHSSPDSILIQTTLLVDTPIHIQPPIKKLRNKKYHIPHNAMAILIDASWDSSQQTGLAAVCYGPQNNLLWTASQHTTSPSVFHAEMLAVLMTIQYILQHLLPGRSKIHIFTDCVLLVNALQHFDRDSLPDWRSEERLIELSRLLKANCDWIQIRQACREALTSPHNLANQRRRDGIPQEEPTICWRNTCEGIDRQLPPIFFIRS